MKKAKMKMQILKRGID